MRVKFAKIQVDDFRKMNETFFTDDKMLSFIANT